MRAPFYIILFLSSSSSETSSSLPPSTFLVVHRIAWLPIFKTRRIFIRKPRIKNCCGQLVFMYARVLPAIFQRLAEFLTKQWNIYIDLVSATHRRTYFLIFVTAFFLPGLLRSFNFSFATVWGLRGRCHVQNGCDGLRSVVSKLENQHVGLLRWLFGIWQVTFNFFTRTAPFSVSRLNLK